ncbi:MAG: sigma-70 family RNA polymerase sigma factor [Planctomycetes bacterium]|nr:sigma-70 family RNA polymerase sigma factor [Planctomycetota bacterium]
MVEIDRFSLIRSRGRILLSDLEPWVQNPELYERERARLVRLVVQRRIALFPDESIAASQRTANSTSSDVTPTDLYQVYMRELRQIPRMERSEEFRFVIALEICKEALALECNLPKPGNSEIEQIANSTTSEDATFLRILEKLRTNPNRRSQPADRAAARIERIKVRLDEMLAWKRVLVFRTLPLVPGMARRYKGMGVPVLDLIQEANASLMKATDRYDWRKSVRFVVYARWWVQQGVLKSLSCQSRTVRTPVYMAQKLKKIRDLNDRSVTETGSRMSAEALGVALDEPAERIERALAAAKMTVSIDRELDPSGEFTLRDTLADPHADDVNDAPAGPSLTNRIDEALSSLTGRERLVLELRYGLHDNHAETLEAVSQKLGVSRERVRQIQEQAIRKLKAPSQHLKLVEFLQE